MNYYRATLYALIWTGETIPRVQILSFTACYFYMLDQSGIVSGLLNRKNCFRFTGSWGMTFADDNTLLVTERNGHILSVDIATGKSTQLMEDPAGLYANGQGGLLDIAMSPFEPNKAYVTYSKRTASVQIPLLLPSHFQTVSFQTGKTSLRQRPIPRPIATMVVGWPSMISTSTWVLVIAENEIMDRT